MFDPKSQNSLLRLRTELNDCCYEPKMKDYISTMIIRIMNYPKKTTEPHHYIKMMAQNKIMMVWYPMSVPFLNRNYNVPIQIYIMKHVPYEPPQIFLEVVQGSAANASNKDIDTKTNRIMTNSLKNWNQYSVIENVLDEIFQSFSRVFPIYKKKTNQQPPIQNQPPVGGGGIYGMLHNEVNNLYQQQNNNNNAYNPYNPMAKYGFQPPTKSIYGRSMTLNENRNRPQPNFFGGGIYGNNNNQQPNSFGGGIYGNNNNQQPSSFGLVEEYMEIIITINNQIHLEEVYMIIITIIMLKVEEYMILIKTIIKEEYMETMIIKTKIIHMKEHMVLLHQFSLH